MNRIYYILLLGGLGIPVVSLRAQEAAPEEEEKKERVQYQLVLPEEKSPESVKPEEHNPFESESEAASRDQSGNTEENRVRDILMRLPVSGMSMDPRGRRRVLLGDIDLTVGEYVPQVLPDQLVELKVKNISQDSIELAWQEKEMIGLPPKIMSIPINMEPSVTIQMKGSQGGESHMTRVTRRSSGITRNGLPVASGQEAGGSPQTTTPLIAQPVTDDPSVVLPRQPAQVSGSPQVPPVAAPPATVSPAIESAVRMLFGNPTPASK